MNELKKANESMRLNSEHTLGMMPTNILLMAIAGKIDLNAWAASELANRGLGMTGEWVNHKQSTLVMNQAINKLNS